MVVRLFCKLSCRESVAVLEGRCGGGCIQTRSQEWDLFDSLAPFSLWGASRHLAWARKRRNLAWEAFFVPSADWALTCWRAAPCFWGWEPAPLPLGLLEQVPASVVPFSSCSAMHLPLPRAKTKSQELIVLCFLFSPLLRCGLIGIWAHWTLESFASPSSETDVGKLNKYLNTKWGDGLSQAGILPFVGLLSSSWHCSWWQWGHGEERWWLGMADACLPARLQGLWRSRVE